MDRTTATMGVLSVGIHALAAHAMRAEAPRFGPVEQPDPVFVELVLDRPKPPEPEPEPEPEHGAPSPAAARSPVPLKRSARRPRRALAMIEAPSTTEGSARVAPSPDPTPEPSAPSGPAARGIDISPAAVAAAAGSLPSGGEDTAPSLDERLSADLHASANARSYLSERPPPELELRADGTRYWDGPVVQAVVSPDGNVRFIDPQAGVELVDGWFPVLHFDITDALERRAGNDPYAAEKFWFLRETEAIRAQMGAQHRRRETFRSRGLVRHRLETIWSSPQSPRQRRRLIFELWDDCAEDDEIGAAARESIVRFIREQLPPGTYSEQELHELNERRISRESFRPYAQ